MRLEEALQRKLGPDSKPGLLLTSGSSGAGKTRLAKRLWQSVEARGGFFVMGKFDQLKRPEPFAPVVPALAEFVKLIPESGGDVVENLRKEIALGAEELAQGFAF